jgi:hypothetical protein
MTDAQLSGTPSAFLHASIIELIAYRDCRCQAWSSHGRDAFDNAEEQRPEPFPSWTSMDVRVSGCTPQHIGHPTATGLVDDCELIRKLQKKLDKAQAVC